MPLVTELSSQADLWTFIKMQDAFIESIQKHAAMRASHAHADAMAADAKIARLTDELAQARAEIATMQAELSALQPVTDPAIDADVQRQFKALWDSCDEPKYPTPRMYKYFVPSCVYPPRRGRRRVYQYHSRLHRHRWMGGIVNKELMALAVHEGLYATPRELAKLRAYAADWDATAEQMLNDSIPW